jgi:fatty-acyl-CoA synthase
VSKYNLSIVSGTTDQPLLAITIGDALRSAAQKFPANDALVSLFQNQRLSYFDLDREVDRVALALLDMGVEVGDRVAIWSANRTEWLIAHHGAVRIGATVVTVNPALRKDEANYVLQDSGAKVVFASRGFRGFSFADVLDEIRANLPELQEIIYFDVGASGVFWQDFLANCQNNETALKDRIDAIDCNLACSLQYTSGTTGKPKGALLTHHNILNNGHFVGERQRLSSVDRICLPVPFFHCFGIVLGALAAVTHGSCIVLPSESFDPKIVLSAIQSEKCTSFYGVPMMYISLISHADIQSTDVSTLRTGCMGGAPCPIETMRQAVDVLNMSEITITYGMTETSPISFQTMPDDTNEVRVTTVGRVHPHIEAKVINPGTGQTVSHSAAGELCVRGYSVMREYWRNPEGTKEAIDKDGWMHTGDLAVMRPDGYVQIVGRIKNTIIRGGENIYPREVEEFLLTLPLVSEAYVFGIPDEKYGEETCVWIKLKANENFAPERIRDLCKGKIATFKIPKYVRFVDSFPTTASGKVQYFRMREAEIELMQNEKNSIAL